MTTRPASGKHSPPTPSGAETVSALLAKSNRDTVPIRRSFLQTGRGAAAGAGPLAEFVRGGDRRGLLAYLLVLAVASAEPWNARYPAGVWVRALGIAETTSGTSARSAVSKVWSRLEGRQLIARSRSGRTADVELLMEDGSGEPYSRPQENYLRVPHSFWTKGHYERLAMPGIAVLLIALAEEDGFELPADRASEWYGISADTIERGLRELRDAGVLKASESYVKTPLSDTGWTTETRYSLIGDLALPPPGANPKGGSTATPAKKRARSASREGAA